MADLRIKVQEIIEKGNDYAMVMEKTLDISDEEILRIGERYKELQKAYLEITADMRGGK